MNPIRNPTSRSPSKISRGQAVSPHAYASASECATGDTFFSCSGRTRSASAASTFAGVTISTRTLMPPT